VSRRDKARGAEKRPRISEFDQFDVRFQSEERRVHLQSGHSDIKGDNVRANK
jgi:hypothetical protein